MDPQQNIPQHKIYPKTKAMFGRLLRPPACNRRRPILVLALQKFVTYLPRHLPTYLQPRDPHGADIKYEYSELVTVISIYIASMSVLLIDRSGPLIRHPAWKRNGPTLEEVDK